MSFSLVLGEGHWTPSLFVIPHRLASLLTPSPPDDEEEQVNIERKRRRIEMKEKPT